MPAPESEGRLARSARRQHGLVTREQALRAGVSSSQLHRERRRGRLRPVERGVYRFATAPVTGHSRLLATCLSAGSVASHRSAAALWQLDGFRPGPLEVTVARGVRVRRSGVAVHETTRPDLLHTRRREGIPVVGPTRLAVDLAAVVSPDRLVGVVDELVRRRLATVDELVRALLRHAAPGRPGVAGLRRVLLEVAGLERIPDSGWSREVARRLVDAGLPGPVLEHEVRDLDGTFVARLDLAWPGPMVAVELDSEAFHLDRVAFQADRARRNRLQLLGWRVLAFTWRDHVHRPEVLHQQVAAALDRWHGAGPATLPRARREQLSQG